MGSKFLFLFMERPREPLFQALLDFTNDEQLDFESTLRAVQIFSKALKRSFFHISKEMRKESANLVFSAIIGFLLRDRQRNQITAESARWLAPHLKVMASESLLTQSHYDIALNVWRDSALSDKCGLILPVSDSAFASRKSGWSISFGALQLPKNRSPTPMSCVVHAVHDIKSFVTEMLSADGTKITMRGKTHADFFGVELLWFGAVPAGAHSTNQTTQPCLGHD